MNWLARLKKTANTPDQTPTKPTKGSFVGFVAPVDAPFAENDLLQDDATNWDEEAAKALIDLLLKRGLRVNDAELLAQDIQRRVADLDERRLCLECRHLSDKVCTRPALAGAGRVVEAIMRMPQRCPAFEGVL